MTANTSKNFSFISHTSSTRTLYIWMVESSMPIAIMLLSWGWNARKVAAGGGGMKVVIVCIQKKIQNSAPDLWVNVEIKKANFPIPWMSSYWTRRSFLQMLTSHKSHSWTKQSRKQLPHGLVRSHHLSLGCHLKVATIEVIHWLLPKQRLPHSSESLLYQMEESNNFGVHLPFHWNCVHFFATSKAGE